MPGTAAAAHRASRCASSSYGLLCSPPRALRHGAQPHSSRSGRHQLFHVPVKDGQRWRYVAPEGHNVTRLAVDRGGLQLREGERVYWEQLSLFGGSDGVIEAQADRESSFVLGSGGRSPRTSSGTVFRLPPCYPRSG